MADSYIQIAPDSTGKLVNNQSLTNGSAQTVYRQTVTVGDPALYGSVQAVRAGGSATVPASDGAAVVIIRDAATIVGSGTAGSPAGGVVSIQGVASGTAMPVSAAALPLPTGASTAALQPTNAAQSSTTSGQTGVLIQGAVTTAAPTYTTAQTNPLSLTTAGALRMDKSSLAGTALGAPTNYGTAPGAVAVQGVNAFVTNVPAVSQSGTWNVTNVSGTVSLPTGASTAALQPTNAAQASTTSGQTGTLIQGAVTTAAPTYTTAQTNPLSLTTGGAVRTDKSSLAGTVLGAPTNYGTAPGAVAVQGVNAFVTNAATQAAQGSTTSGQNGTLILGAVTTAAPTYTTAQSNALSLTTGGALRVDASAAAITQANTAVGSAAIATGQAAITSTISTAVAARTGVAGTGRIDVTLYNNGANTVFVGPTGITVSTGIPILPGGEFTITTQAAIFAICAATLTSTLAYLETF